MSLRAIGAGALQAALLLPGSLLPAALLAAALLPGCGGGGPGVSSFPHPPFAVGLRVPMPPPPAQIESLSHEPPAPACRWLDGQWAWTSQRWDWRPGGWIQPPQDCRYSLPSLAWVDEQGAPALYYRPGRWYSVKEPRACPDPAPCGGASARGSPPSSPSSSPVR